MIEIEETDKTETITEIKSESPDLPMPRICVHCVYFYRDSEQGGQCRLAPPKFIIIPGKLAGQQEVRGLFPPVSIDCWCGEYEAK